MKLFVFGLGYSALHLVRSHKERFCCVAGTTRGPEAAKTLAQEGIAASVWDGTRFDPVLAEEVSRSQALLVSIPPGEDGDPVLAHFSAVLATAPRLRWIGYLSTVGVYGDRGGAWVDEDDPPRPASTRSVRRMAAEEDWLALGERSGKAVQIFRLAGIYGPGRNALAQVEAGTAKRIVKPGQVFNRIHVADVARVLLASLDRPRAGAIYNVADDEPAPPQDVVAHAAALLGMPAPPPTPFAEAALSPMAASFYGENKRVRNSLLRGELGVALAYPTYREGLRALAGRERGEKAD